jgi:PKD repeat protein
MAHKLLMCLVFVYNLSGYGQLETAQWRFGYKAGLSFQSGNPLSVPSCNMWNQFSSSSIADSLGNLLFYVRAGDLVYNKANDTMANGINIGGYYGGVPASIIVRKSGSKYYVITHNNANYFSPSPIPPMTNYAIVDMSLAAGLGSVIASSQSISPAGLPMVGKLAATKHCNQKDHWILTHVGGYPGSNLYYAYLAGASGISTVPVISAIGSNQPQAYFQAQVFNRGMHKFSPNGRKMCATMHFRTVELYDFDPGTGLLSNVFKIDSVINPSPAYTSSDPNALGIEFSPDGSKLYISYANNHPFLCQFNLAAGSPSAIAASKTIISQDTVVSQSWYYDLQLAPDGKIYVVNTNSVFLGAISNPNANGILCNYIPQAQALGTIISTPFFAQAGSGLPSFESYFFEQKPKLSPINNSFACGVVTFTPPVLSAFAGYSVTSYYWNFNDPLSGSNTSTLSNPTHTFSANGTYTVKLALNYYPCGTDTITQMITVLGLPNPGVSGKTSICKGESTVLTFSGGSTYTLNNTAITQNTAQLQPTITSGYTLTVKDNSTGCSAKKTFTVTVLPCTSISENSIEEAVLLFPNPNQGLFSIQVMDLTQIRLLDLNGQEMFRSIVPPGIRDVDMSMYAKGMYFLELSNSKMHKTLKLMIQ